MMFYYSEYMLLHVITIYHHKIHTCNFICYKPKISNSSPVHISAVAIILKKKSHTPWQKPLESVDPWRSPRKSWCPQSIEFSW